MEYPDLDDEIRWGAERFCKDLQPVRDTQRFDVSFGADKKLVIIQDIAEQPSHAPAVDVYGSVVFRRIGADSPQPSVVVEITVNDARIDVSVKWDADEQTLVVTVPRGFQWNGEQPRSWYVLLTWNLSICSLKCANKGSQCGYKNYCLGS